MSLDWFGLKDPDVTSEENERIEKLTGSRDILPQKFSITCGRLTKQQKLHLIEAIDKQRDMGLPAPKAAKIYGVHHCTYTKWRRVYSLGRYVRKWNTKQHH